MAELSISVGNLSSSVTASNAKAQAVLTAYMGAFYGPLDGTPQEQLDWIAGKLAAHIVEVAQDHNRALKAAAAMEDAEADKPTWAE